MKLNQELGIHLYSFPMKYVPLDAKDRSYIGIHWNKRLLRGVQCIMLITKGKISPSRAFFEAAFGRSAEEFIQIAMMPDEYIIYRETYKTNAAYDWRILYNKLNTHQKERLVEIVSNQAWTESMLRGIPASNLRKILAHYVEAHKAAQLRRYEGKKSRSSVSMALG